MRLIVKVVFQLIRDGEELSLFLCSAFTFFQPLAMPAAIGCLFFSSENLINR
jgi:hypothetical protein